MSGLGNIHVEALDLNGASIFKYDAPPGSGVTARELLEASFVGLQRTDLRDPFVFTLEFFGYSTDPQFPGYLGYEVESIGRPGGTPLSNSTENYWELLMNGQQATEGADALRPLPGSRVTWQFTSMQSQLAGSSVRAKLVKARRSRGD